MKQVCLRTICMFFVLTVCLQPFICLSEEQVAFCIYGGDGYLERLEEFFCHHVELVGQSVLIEGYLYDISVDELERDHYYFVYQWGPSCCDDGLSREGMEVAWMTDDGQYPEAESYVRAVGIVRIYEDHGYQLIRLELTSLENIPEYVQMQ